MKYSKIELAKQAFKHKGFIQKIPVIVRMLKSTFKKEYKPEFKNVLVPGLVLVYLISPLDFLPDWIPFIGALDDLALLAIAIPMLMKETERFVAWETTKSGNPQILEAEIIE